jgi:hypothetical protein
MDKHESEQINLEYIVKFKDGFRPRLKVYGIDSKAGEIYGADIRIGVSVSAGYDIRPPSEEDFKKHILAMVGMGINLDASWIISKFRAKFPENKNWEQEQYEACREEGTNVIRVQNPDHIQSAIDRHVDLYREQFHTLGERFVKLFQRFIRKHPGYEKY